MCRQGFLEAQQRLGEEESCFLGYGGGLRQAMGAQSPGSLYEGMECTPEFPLLRDHTHQHPA